MPDLPATTAPPAVGPISKNTDGSFNLLSDGSQYIPRNGDVIRCNDGSNYTIETNFAGVAIFDQLKPGAYRIQETSAPLGWQKDDTIHTTTVTAGETTVFPLVNKALPRLRIIQCGNREILSWLCHRPGVAHHPACPQ